MTTKQSSKIDLTGLKKSTPKSSGKKDYPFLPDQDGEIKEIVDSVLHNTQQIEALQGAVDVDGATLKSRVVQWTYAHFNGRGDVPTTVKLLGSEGKAVAVSLTSKYYPIPTTVGTDSGEAPNPKLEAIQKTVGEEAFEEFFEEGFTITIDSSKIPAEQAQEFIQALVVTCSMYGADEAVSAKQFVKPKAAFHAERHRRFTTDQNFELNKHLPPTVSLKTKGVKV